MMKLQILTLALLVSIAAGPVRTEPLGLDEISDYLNAQTTAQGKFTQINPDGTISTGTIYIRRPGRVRFEYDPPNPALVMAGGGAVAIFDKKSDQLPQQFPLKQTPLSVILQRNIDLKQADMITAITSDDTSTTITAQDPERPEIGNIQLVFTSAPVELRQWVITDEAGTQTTVILRDLQQGLRLKGGLFNIAAEIQKLQPDR